MLIPQTAISAFSFRWASRVGARFLAGLFVTCGTAFGAAETIVWDQGPTTGLATPAEGNRSVWVNASFTQNFTDSVVFAEDTFIVGFNLFTSSSRLPQPIGTLYRVRFLLDDHGIPGSLFAERIVTAESIQFVGDFLTTAGEPADIYQVSLRFAPVHLVADATYWIGATGLGLDVGQYGVVGSGDGRMALMNQDNFITITDNIGDQMFQLLGESGVGLVEHLVPCAGPLTGGRWKNHGEYVSTVTKVAKALAADGVIHRKDAQIAIRAAAQSSCGR